MKTNVQIEDVLLPADTFKNNSILCDTFFSEPRCLGFDGTCEVHD